ncbi:MAG: PIG-L family deacetylase [Verrucomicrobiales bacterium]|jgi:LmbE family N-acetylglucosaminyl deacetylase|nr:PIG-L family deacetylase [Verrucomicrobiales bacterium]
MSGPTLAAKNPDWFVPDAIPVGPACLRTTHLSIAAHQDDTEIMAFHGIAECYQKNARWFGAIVVTDGAGSPRAGAFANYSNTQMKLVRKIEQRKAAALGKYSFVCQLGYPSADIRNADHAPSVSDLAAILGACQPRVVYVHNLADKHETHIALALKSIAALRRLPANRRPKKVYGCEIWRDLDWLADDQKIELRVDQNEVLARRLLDVFQSQVAGGKRYDLAAIGRRIAHATFSEPRQTDQAAALTWAMDLSPLMMNDALTPQALVKQYLDNFNTSVLAKLG